MSDTMPDNLLRRVRYTPLADLLRGRVSGRFDVKGRIEASKLPREVKDLLWRVVKRTRLWTGEKIEVAEELMGHFEDGMASGEGAADLMTSFGDAKKAAKLIRRAKRRGRPIAWHILRAIGCAVLGLIVIYAFLTARFLMGRPTPKVDYLEAMNRKQLSVAEEQRGWPTYRQALLAMGTRMWGKEEQDRLGRIFDARPGSKYWGEVGPWLAGHEKVVELTRRAAARPVLGFVLGRNGSIKDPELYPGREQFARPMSPGEEPVLSVLLPHLYDLKQLTNVLASDLRFAREQGDAARALRDIEALGNMARQLHNDGEILVIDLVAVGIWGMQLKGAEEVVVDEKLKLSNEDFQKLAHLLAWPRVAGDVISFHGERLMVHDVIQRAYTDDGHGDGHLTLEGQKFLKEIGAVGTRGLSGYPAVYNEVLTVAATPLSASRKDVTEQYDQLMDIADANLRRPMRETDWEIYGTQAATRERPATMLRRGVLRLMEAQLGWTQVRVERFLGHRDGIVVGIALEMYRREKGVYPKSLEELSPRFLPEIPRDRITGDLVKWRLINGKPVVYSVGADGDDDGGKMPIAPGKKVRRWDAADWFITSGQKPADGDWVLYPLGEEATE